MNRPFAIISILMALFLLNGCSYFVHKDPLPEHVAPLLPALNLVEQKIPPESCDDHCAKQGVIKKKFCLKKCEYKKKRAEKKALVALCESKQDDWWSRLIHKNKDNSADECSYY